jgi:alpha-tubulin suppressor-like RCC1 family protein
VSVYGNAYAGQMAATKTDGTLWLWGGADFTGGPILGDNTTVSRSSPVQTISGGTNWKSVSATGGVFAAIKTDGTLWAWGFNNFGNLGTNTTITQSSPVQTISGGTNWRSVSGKNGGFAAIKTDGTLWLWGRGCYGGLGNNSTINQSSPIQTVSGGTNWRSVDRDSAVTGAIKTDGTLWVWGFNGGGRLGINSTIYRSSPVQTISGGTNWRSVSVGTSPTAIREDCW